MAPMGTGRSPLTPVVLLLLLLITPGAHIIATAQEDDGPGVEGDPDDVDGDMQGSLELPDWILEVTPAPAETVGNRTPQIVVIFDPEAVDPSDVTMTLGAIEVNEHDDYTVGPDRIEYTVASVFALSEGDTNITVSHSRPDGTVNSFTWSFTVDLTPPAKESVVTLSLVVTLVLVVLGALIATAIIVLAYLKKTRNFTLRKHFARNPVQRELLVLYIPLGIAGICTLGMLYWLTTLSTTPRFAHEFVVLGGLLLGLGPYAVDVQHQRARIAHTERAFSQFLFELADALRGGIDPLKAIRELATTETGLLARPLRIAADGIRIGRPFDSVMAEMAKRLKSPLIERYSLLVAESASIGGEIASVVHRAAKDMDEMVKVEQERRRQLKTPIMTMYIAFGVLLLMVKSLMDFAPGFADTDFGGLTPAISPDGTSSVKASRMDLPQLQGLFFHLVMITSSGTGLLIGCFTDGRLRNGLVHAFIMTAIAGLFYRFVVL